MKKIFILILSVAIFSCNESQTKGKFTVSGNIKNAPDQKAYLEEIHFDNQGPAIIDTGEIKNGKLSLSGIAAEQGLYRIRLADRQFFIINDQDNISFDVDYAKREAYPNVYTSANASLKNLLNSIDSISLLQQSALSDLNLLNTTSASDSILKFKNLKIDSLKNYTRNFISTYADTTTNPVVGIIALGYSTYFTDAEIKTHLLALAKRFPDHSTVNLLANKFAQQPAKQNTDNTAADVAPELTMPDTSGKSFSLSSLRGKYVLVDFWASWCGPCREENPNVVAAYNRFKNKNFTVLGVSLDKQKDAWINAIKEDGLTWTHISDLKFWNSAAVDLYQFEGIPYNVLIDPQGKIIARELRGEELSQKLAEILK